MSFFNRKIKVITLASKSFMTNSQADFSQALDNIKALRSTWTFQEMYLLCQCLEQIHSTMEQVRLLLSEFKCEL